MTIAPALTWTVLYRGSEVPHEGEMVLVTVDSEVRCARYLGYRPSPVYYGERVPTWEGVEPEELVMAWAYPTGLAPHTW